MELNSGFKNADGRTTLDEREMEQLARGYFFELFWSNSSGDPSYITTSIRNVIYKEMNAKLELPYTTEEVFSVVKGIGPTKASGNDSFPTLFFQSYWSILGFDIIDYCLNILNNEGTLDELKCTNIVLIPKIPHPSKLSNFRPISLCNILYKIVVKMIVFRFKGVLDICIDESRSAFVPNRLIFDNVLLAYEIIYTFC